MKAIAKAVKDALLSEQNYIYTNPEGQKITVYVIEDCGDMQDRDGQEWRKVLCRPIGFNNAPLMSLDFNKLVAE